MLLPQGDKYVGKEEINELAPRRLPISSVDVFAKVWTFCLVDQLYKLREKDRWMK